MFKRSLPLLVLFSLLSWACDDGAMGDDDYEGYDPYASGAGGGGGTQGFPADPAFAADTNPEPGMEPERPLEEYEENDFVDASEDALATFSVDTDTASYSQARAALNSGVLPDAGDIRVEEFINYFNYEAEAHGPDELFKIQTEVAPSPFGEGLHMLRVSLKGREVDPREQRPNNLVFLVDVSGSMSAPDKLGLIKRTLIQLVSVLDAEDTLSLVTYAGSDQIVLRPTPVSHYREILDAIDGLTSGGSTNGASGINTAYELAEGAYREGGNNRVILCTDGDFNVGATSGGLVDLVASWRDRGVTLSVLGVGYGLNDQFLEELTNKSDGTYHFLDSAREARRVVVALASGTLQVIAKEVKIQVELNPQLVARYRLVGYENRDIADDDFRDDTVDAGEISSGHQVTAFLELEMKAGAPGDDATLATVRVRYKAPDAVTADPAVEISHPHVARESYAGLEGTSDAFRFGLAVTEFAEILRGSKHVDAPDFERLIGLARRAAGAHEDRQEMVELAEIAHRLMP